MTTGPAIDIARLRTWIGRQEEGEELLTEAAVARFEATFALAGLESGREPGDSEAPGLIHWCLAQPAAATGALTSDGHRQGGDFLPPVPLPRRMWAGGALTFAGAPHIGETISRTSRIADVAIKAGRTGTLCFVTVEHAITSGGRLVVEERQDIVFREAAAGAAAGPVAADVPTAPLGRHHLFVNPSAALLFRYSALTFNAHRIHYDRAYASEVEGYAGLVVHGPLQASLLYRFATRIAGAPPTSFSFRGLAPFCDGADFSLNAEPEGADLRLWTARAGGPVAMSASAGWQ